LSLLAKQIDRLERERREVPHRIPHYGGLWLGLPVLFALAGLGIKYGHSSLDKARPFALWAGFGLTATVFVFACVIYQNRVSIKTQLIVDLIAWSVLVWMFFHFRFWEP
jgi:multidrug transporter EmrE-like cation transporter